MGINRKCRIQQPHSRVFLNTVPYYRDLDTMGLHFLAIVFLCLQVLPKKAEAVPLNTEVRRKGDIKREPSGRL